MMATVPHVTSGSGLRKFQADGFLFDRVYRASCTVYYPDQQMHSAFVHLLVLIIENSFNVLISLGFIRKINHVDCNI